MDSGEDHDALAQTFSALTGASPEVATQYLSANNWELNLATDAFYEDDGNENDAATASSPAVPADYTGPRTLDGRPVPQAIPTTSSAASKRPQKKTGLATLSSLGGGSSHNHDDDDSDDDDHPSHRDTYAGGEKSGLAVQDPNQRADPKRIINDILAKAKSNARRPESSEESPAGPSSSSAFRGGGQTLGGEGSESRYIPDPTGAAQGRARPQAEEVQERTLHLWRDGFSVDDGELHRFDDPANAESLRMIQQGRAPIHLMNVRFDDPIDVKLQKHDENYRQLPKKYKPFGSSGRRLGSPVPGEATGAAASASTATATSNTPAAAQSSSSGPSSSIDESQPTVTIRIQMLDGSRLPARFNTTQTVNDIYEFISRASPGLSSGGWVLATTFPNKDHTDKSLVLGEMPEFKKGGTAVVKRST